MPEDNRLRTVPNPTTDRAAIDARADELAAEAPTLSDRQLARLRRLLDVRVRRPRVGR